MEVKKNTSLIQSNESEVVKSFIKAFNKADHSSKELFVQAFKLFKQHKGKEQQVKVNFTASLSKLSLGNDAIITRGKRIIKLAEQYTTLKAVSNFSELHFYNLESIVKVLLFIEENHALVYSTIRNRIASVYDIELKRIEYNNAMKAELSKIKQEFGLVEQEGEIVSLDGKLKGILMALSVEDKAEVIAMLGGVMVEADAVA